MPELGVLGVDNVMLAVGDLAQARADYVKDPSRGRQPR